ncbi:MAG: hypothetical protein ACYCYP_14225 [Leptospirales bacterium]
MKASVPYFRWTSLSIRIIPFQSFCYPGNENENDGQCLLGVVLSPFGDFRLTSLNIIAIFQMNDFRKIYHERSGL